ncbi:UNKNOWN [Stylonychia lemnae]|uniref:Uncharacterized protein n=1 Tax=Stylonychia lemnae TaxID=5949 RepID=A0A078B0F0_STYLE|nr:UNKNOWN [Stylonychia lemnae]|eukprot:CDW87994.1 UNKNOWN [Stylonychia lemnae]
MSTQIGLIRFFLTRKINYVNQIVSSDIILVFSCSNDTTIKIWSLRKFYRQLNDIQTQARMRSVVSLNDDIDYIRAIDYSSFNNTLYSVCDNGIVRQWDVDAATLAGQVDNQEQVKIRPQGGNIIAIGYTDEVIKIIDMRIRGDQSHQFELRGEHQDSIRQVKLSPDGMVCLSAGSDATFKVWDMSMRKCVKTHGGEQGIQKKYSSFHRDTITTQDVDFESDLAFTGGRDGSIFMNRIVHHKYQKIYQGDAKQMITCLKYDDINSSLWFGTPDSSFSCIKIDHNHIDNTINRQEVKYLSNNKKYKKGLPWITEYHILKNKRYILTNTSENDKVVNLWSLENGKIIKTWTQKTFQQVISIVSKQYDLNLTTGSGSSSSFKKPDIIPQQWFSCDIKLGSVTIHLDEDNWLKGNVIDNETNVEKMLLERNSEAKTNDDSDFYENRRDKNRNDQMQKALNLGFNLGEKLFKEVQVKYQKIEKIQLTRILGDNFKDYVELKNNYLGISENMDIGEEQKDESKIDDDECLPFFIFLQEADIQKPIWTSYGNDLHDIEKLVYYLPLSMQKNVQRSIPNIDSQNKISLGINTVGIMDLPKFSDGKRLTCSPTTPICDLITFLSSKLEFQKHFLVPENQFDPIKNVEIVLPVYQRHSLKQISTKTEAEYDKLIVLDINLTLVVIFKLLLPFTNNPNLIAGSSTLANNQMNLFYRKKKIEYSPIKNGKIDQIETFRDLSGEKH